MAIDLAFVIDVTGSMAPWLEACKAQIKAISEGLLPRITQQYPSLGLQLRYALVAYRDVCDGAHQFEVMDFTPDVNALSDKVHTLGLCSLLMCLYHWSIHTQALDYVDTAWCVAHSR